MRRTEPRLIGKDAECWVDFVVTQQRPSSRHSAVWAGYSDISWLWRNGARRWLVCISLVNISRFHLIQGKYYTLVNRIFISSRPCLWVSKYSVCFVFFKRIWHNNRFFELLVFTTGRMANDDTVACLGIYLTRHLKISKKSETPSLLLFWYPTHIHTHKKRLRKNVENVERKRSDTDDGIWFTDGMTMRCLYFNRRKKKSKKV